jgi:hypothetical protein
VCDEWCDCSCCDDWEPTPVDPNNVWHGPKTKSQQQTADMWAAAYGNLLTNLLKPIRLFSDFAPPAVDGVVTFNIVEDANDAHD